MSDFSGLRITLSSLYAQRKALHVTGQNIANVNTEGYRDGLAAVAQQGDIIEDLGTNPSDLTDQLETQNQLSEVEGVDLPATIVELQLQEVAYQAALGATAKVLQPTLTDFLR